MATFPSIIARAFVRGVSRVVDRESAKRDEMGPEEVHQLLDKSWRRVGEAIASASAEFKESDEFKRRNG